MSSEVARCRKALVHSTSTLQRLSIANVHRPVQQIRAQYVFDARYHGLPAVVQVVVEEQQRALARRHARQRLARGVEEERAAAAEHAVVLAAQVEQCRHEAVSCGALVAAVVVSVTRISRKVAVCGGHGSVNCLSGAVAHEADVVAHGGKPHLHRAPFCSVAHVVVARAPFGRGAQLRKQGAPVISDTIELEQPRPQPRRNVAREREPCLGALTLLEVAVGEAVLQRLRLG
mmetsp:Transcript_34487/g.80797  ORF Transcript_34487/g.80797 Transcript_34487/m.80797 type:complete len:231 (-) Transcript_34487:329-1021(-)